MKMIMLMSMATFLNLKKGTTQALGSAILEQVDRNIDGGEFDKECLAGEYAELQFEKEKSEMNSELKLGVSFLVLPYRSKVCTIEETEKMPGLL
ncbi:hypothetical protein JHK87_012928 [Glycine soja]|nr:hypothetical protein JHK87_012928 [Glycine soja]